MNHRFVINKKKIEELYKIILNLKANIIHDILIIPYLIKKIKIL